MILKLSLTALIFLFAGIVLSSLFFSNRRNKNELYTLLNDFKKTIDEYKIQNTLTAKEIENALKDTTYLAKILTTNQNLKGQYGEDCLETILNCCFPQKDVNYVKQYVTKNVYNEEVRPDYIVNLPNNKKIIIDCKLNLEKYIAYKENQNSIEKNNLIKDLNNTINNLANKKYETAHNINQPDFILMYIPLEPVLTTIYTDKDFISVVKNATEKNIIIVGNSGILTTIKLIKLIWSQNSQKDNFEKIIDIAQNLYELIANHSQNLYNLKCTLEENTKNFNKEFEKITNNNKIFKTIEQLKEYGIDLKIKKNGKKLEEIKINENFLN